MLVADFNILLTLFAFGKRVKCDENDDEIYQLLAEGIVISRVTNEVYMELECSSPILRSIMLSMVCGPEFDITNPPQMKDEIDVRWLLENTIEVGIHISCLYRIVKILTAK